MIPGQTGFDGSGMRMALVVSRFNEPITDKLLTGAESCLDEHGCASGNRRVVRVPGAWEIPLAVKRLAELGGVDAIIALGALIRGETAHFDYLAQQVARGLGQVALETGIPVIFGVLTTESVEQALARAGGGHGHKGQEAALAALEMAQLFRELRSGG